MNSEKEREITAPCTSLQIKASQYLINYSDPLLQFILESATGTEIEKHKKAKTTTNINCCIILEVFQC